MEYSNFKDPIGLLRRMLASGNRVAYSILFREGLSKLLVPLDFLLQRWEKKKLKAGEKRAGHPIILVLGGSRNGTTLLYQTLAHYLSVSYISNFIAAFHRSPITAYSLFHRLLPKSDGNFRNFFGSVEGSGGPNDAFFLWNRWLGGDRNRIPEKLSPETKSDMKRFFDTWSGVSQKAFLNKNNRNSLCAATLASVLDRAYFIEIHRDPVYVAQSLILSRRKVQGDEMLGWGLLNVDSKAGDDPLRYIDDVCEQVYRVDRAIAHERQNIDPKRYIRISYERFCQNPSELVLDISRKTEVGIRNMEYLAAQHFSTASNAQRLNDDEFERIRRCIENLYGKKESV